MDACEEHSISIGFYILGIFIFISGMFGLVVNISVFIGLVRCLFLPGNVRVLLGNMTLGIVFMIFFGGWGYFSRLISVFFGHLAEVSVPVCLFNSTQAVTTIVVVIISMGSLGEVELSRMIKARLSNGKFI